MDDAKLLKSESYQISSVSAPSLLTPSETPTKPSVPPIFFTSGSSSNLLHTPSPPDSSPSSPASDFNCDQCRHPLSGDWKICPYCAAPCRPPMEELKCFQCAKPVQADWLACPFCTAALFSFTASLENTEEENETTKKDRVVNQARRRVIEARLDKDMSKSDLSMRPGYGGTRLVEGWRAIEKANKIFGWDNWSSYIIDVSTDFVEQSIRGFSVGCTAIVRVQVGKNFHEGVGYGAATAKSKPAALETAKKEAVTDATKRALRYYGNALGNRLYDREYLRQIGVDESEGTDLNTSGSTPTTPHVLQPTKSSSAIITPVSSESEKRGMLVKTDKKKAAYWGTL